MTQELTKKQNETLTFIKNKLQTSTLIAFIMYFNGTCKTTLFLKISFISITLNSSFKQNHTFIFYF